MFEANANWDFHLASLSGFTQTSETHESDTYSKENVAAGSTGTISGSAFGANETMAGNIVLMNPDSIDVNAMFFGQPTFG